MKKLMFLTSALFVTVGLLCSCNKKDDTDMRDKYVGDYVGTRTTTQTVNSSTMNSDNTCTMRVKKNESNSKSIVVYPTTSKELLFYTENMKVVTINGVEAYCGNIKSENFEDAEEGTSTIKEGVNISEEIPYECAIIPNEAGGYTFMYNFKNVIQTSHNTQVLQTDSFIGTKE